jgi:hypothetical protein
LHLCLILGYDVEAIDSDRSPPFMPTVDVVARQAEALREKWEDKVEAHTGVPGGAERRVIAESALEDLRKIAANLSRLTSEDDGLPQDPTD